MTTIVDLQHGSLSATATSRFGFKPLAFMTAVAVTAAVITSSVLTGGVLQRDGLLNAVSTSSMTASASVVQAAHVSATATSSMTAVAGSYSASALSPLNGLSSNYLYGEGRLSFAPLTSDSLGDVSVPYYAFAATNLSPLIGDSIMLTGGVGRVAVTLLAMAGASGDYPYAGSSFPLAAAPNLSQQFASAMLTAGASSTFTSSVLTGGILQRDGLLNAVSASSMLVEYTSVAMTSTASMAALAEATASELSRPSLRGSFFTPGQGGSYLEPLITYSFDPGPPESLPGGVTRRTEFMSDVLFALEGAAAASVYSASVSSGMTVTPTLVSTLVVDKAVAAEIVVTDAFVPGAVYIIVVSEIITVRSTVGRSDAFVTWVLNQNTAANSAYTGFDFNSIIHWRGRILAAGDAGVYNLDGNDDNGVPIVSSILLGKTDFDNSFGKQADEVYLGVQAEGELHVKVGTDDGRRRTYRALPIRQLYARRVQLGKKLFSRYWQFEITNPDGGDFTLESAEIIPTVSKRRR